MFIPLGAVFGHLVEDGQEFADAGDEGDLEGFAGGDETVVEGADFVVGTGGGQGGHVERVAQGGAAAGDHAFALVLAGVAVEGLHAGEGGDFLAVELSEFGQFGQEDGGGGGADAGDAAEALGQAGPVVVGVDEGGDFLLNSVDMFSQECDGLLEVLPGLGVGRLFEARQFHGAQGDELAAAYHQRLELGLYFRGFLGSGQVAIFGAEGQGAAVDLVGLGQDAQALGQVACPFGIDDGHGEFDIEQGGNAGAFVAAGGFQDDAGDGARLELCDDLGVTFRRVGHLEVLAGGTQDDIEGVFGDINAAEEWGVSRTGHGDTLSCACELAVLEPPLKRLFGLQSSGAAGITLGDGVKRLRDTIDLPPAAAPSLLLPPKEARGGGRHYSTHLDHAIPFFLSRENIQDTKGHDKYSPRTRRDTDVWRNC